MQVLKEGGFNELVVIVDNKAAKENVSRFLKKSDAKIIRIETEGSKYHIFAEVKDDMQVDEIKGEDYACDINPITGKTIFIASDAIGTGSDELGQKLMKAFLYTLTTFEQKPACLLFMNSAVKLCIEGSDSISNLKTLSDNGTEILVCGTCLDYYGITDKLQVGKISNMYDIAGHLNDDEKVIKI